VSATASLVSDDDYSDVDEQPQVAHSDDGQDDEYDQSAGEIDDEENEEDDNRHAAAAADGSDQFGCNAEIMSPIAHFVDASIAEPSYPPTYCNDDREVNNATPPYPVCDSLLLPQHTPIRQSADADLSTRPLLLHVSNLRPDVTRSVLPNSENEIAAMQRPLAIRLSTTEAPIQAAGQDMQSADNHGPLHSEGLDIHSHTKRSRMPENCQNTSQTSTNVNFHCRQQDSPPNSDHVTLEGRSSILRL